MTDLQKLNVSLTKHGAHKISRLLQAYDSNQLLNNLDSIPDINIDMAQAKKNLSVINNHVPQVWDDARSLGNDAINGLVLVAIIFSHYKLIYAMKSSSNGYIYQGKISNGIQLIGKEYTNFARILKELGFSTNHNTSFIEYNLSKLFHIFGFSKLVNDLLKLKLVKAGWNENNSIIDEMVALNFHDVFSISQGDFVQWLQVPVYNAQAPIYPTPMPAVPVTPYPTSVSVPPLAAITLSPGHTPYKTGTVVRNVGEPHSTVSLSHNEIQNELYYQKVNEYGKGYVFTEVATNQGTFIDLVVQKNDQSLYLYEIKTDSSVKSCIRQAFSQLMEYAYWQPLGFHVDKLIVVSPLEKTIEAENYLCKLRDDFGINIYYEQFISNKYY